MSRGFCVATAAASFRAATEDRFAVHGAPGGLVVVVADGAGGVPGGAAAADRVLELVERTLGQGAFDPFTWSWAELLRQADAMLDSDRTCGETTAVVVAVSGGRLVGASCGDSAAWVVEGDAYDDLTARQHRKRRLGSGRAEPVAFERASFVGTLLVATDGLFSYAKPTDVCACALESNLDGAASRLVELARLPRSGDLLDDVAIVLVRPAPA